MEDLSLSGFFPQLEHDKVNYSREILSEGHSFIAMITIAPFGINESYDKAIDFSNSQVIFFDVQHSKREMHQ